MGHYSFVVINESGDIVSIPQNFLLLDEGQNVFNAQVDDLDKFVADLKVKGVRVVRTYGLNEFETVDPRMLSE